MSFGGVAGPLHGLHKRREFDDLRGQRAVKDPPRADGDLGSAALTARQIDLDAGVAGFDAHGADQEAGENPQPNEYSHYRGNPPPGAHGGEIAAEAVDDFRTAGT